MTKPYIVKCYVCGDEKRRETPRGFKCSNCRGTYKPKGWKYIKADILKRDKVCKICGDHANLHVHHLDGDRRNNDYSNLETRCLQCHLSMHSTGKAPIGFRWGEFGKRLVY